MESNHRLQIMSLHDLRLAPITVLDPFSLAICADLLRQQSIKKQSCVIHTYGIMLKLHDSALLV